MSVAHIPARIPPIVRRIPVKRSTFNGASNLKARNLARKKREQIVFWGIIAGATGLVCLFLVAYFTIGTVNASVSNQTGNSSRVSLSPSLSEVYFKKPLSLNTGSTKFTVAFTGVSFGREERDKIMFKLNFSLKNLGPRDSWSPEIYGELKTDKGNMYGGRYAVGIIGNDSEMVEIDKTTEGYVFFWIPKNCTPVEIQLTGSVKATIKIPKSLVATKPVIINREEPPDIPIASL